MNLHLIYVWWLTVYIPCATIVSSARTTTTTTARMVTNILRQRMTNRLFPALKWRWTESDVEQLEPLLSQDCGTLLGQQALQICGGSL
jgi:hypothetical protein